MSHENPSSDFMSRVDPSLLPALRSIPQHLVDLSDIKRARQALADYRFEPDGSYGVNTVDIVIPSNADLPSVPVRLYYPTGSSSPGPLLYWIHGGGLVMGSIATEDATCRRLAAELGSAIASVEYRLAPEHPYPAQIMDVYAGLMGIVDRSHDLGIDESRLAIGGGSAGGGLAAALALMARDRGQPRLLHQFLLYPMLDDREVTVSSRSITFPHTWNRDANRRAWRALLGKNSRGDAVSPYAAPARASDFSGLPATYIAVGEMDLFRDECIDFATRLLHAGVPTELHVYQGAFHGCDMLAPHSPISERWNSERISLMRRVLGE